MKRALVLCGGGSLGSYEVGVWKFLREKGIHFDIVTGTSIGAINGAMVVANDFEKAEMLWRSVAADKVMVNGMNFYDGFLKDYNDEKRLQFKALAKSFFAHHGADITPLMKLVASSVDTKKIRQSKIVLGVTTTAYPSLKEIDIVLNKLPPQKILDYLHASSACFPIFPIYEIDKKKYVDGGYNNNLPIDFALKLGATEIVAVLLHAIPRIPQHPEMMSLPFVTTIRPSQDTGSIMDFDGKIERDNMTLGYNDARKTYHELWGFAYSFEKSEPVLKKAEELCVAIAKEHPYHFFRISKALSFNDVEPKTSLDIYLRTLEKIGEWLKLDYLPVYTIDGFIKLILSTLKKRSAKTGLLAEAKKHKFGLILAPNEREAYLVLLYYLAKHHQKADRLDLLFTNSEEIAAIKNVFMQWVEDGYFD